MPSNNVKVFLGPAGRETEVSVINHLKMKRFALHLEG